jgi:hypothetical protein
MIVTPVEPQARADDKAPHDAEYRGCGHRRISADDRAGPAEAFVVLLRADAEPVRFTFASVGCFERPIVIAG